MAKIQNKCVTGFTWLILIAISIFAVRYQLALLNYMEWGDESETIVIAKMLSSGMSLYDEVFSQHGPLVYLFGIIVEKLGFSGIHSHRISIVVLQIFAILALFFSPVFKNVDNRNIFVAIAGAMFVIYLSRFFGHMYIYHAVGGLFLFIIIVQYSIPSIILPEKLKIHNVAIGSALVGALPFLAVTYLPAAVLLFIASMRKKFVKASLISMFGAVFACTAFLIYIGSFRGYIALHFFLNFSIYSSMPHTSLANLSDIYQSAISVLSYDIGAFLLFTVLIFSLVAMASGEGKYPWRTVILGIGIATLLVRGGSFWGLPFYYSLLAMPIIFFMRMQFEKKHILFLACFAVVCLTKLSLLIPDDKQRFIARKTKEATEFSRLVKQMTDKNDRIIAYSFRNLEYILSDRLPASGNIYYLPQQYIYNKKSILGINPDACKDIESYQPKIMLIDKWNAWGHYAWDEYGQCVQDILDAHYVQVVNKPYYVLRGFLAEYMNIDSAEMAISPSLDCLMSQKIDE